MAALSTRVSLRRAPVPKTLKIEGPGYIAFSEKFSPDSSDPIGIWNPSEFALFAVIEGFVGISYTISWWKAELPDDFKFIIAPDGSNLTTKTPIPEWNGKTKVEITNVGNYLNPSKSGAVIGCTLTWSNGVDVITVSRAKPIQISKETSTYGHYITRLITSIESLEKQENSLINNQPPVSTTIAQEMSSAKAGIKGALSDLRNHLQNNSWYATDTRQKVKDCDNKLLLYTNAVGKAQSYLSNNAWTTAISKVTNYTSQPTTYKKGDFWTLEKDYTVAGKVWKEGSRVSATTDSNSFNWAHWKNPNFITLSDIAVGGVNLLKKSKRVVVPRRFEELKPSETIKAGTTVTISVGRITSDFNGQFRILFRKTDGWHEPIFFDKSDKPQSQTIALPDPVTGVLFYSSNVWQDTQDYTTTWEDIKIEVGNVATAWSPAPEDVEEKVNLNILSSSVVTKNSAKASSLLDNITKKRKEIEARYLKISPICPRPLASQFLNVFTNYKGAEESLRNACNSFISGSNQTDEQYLNLIGEASTNGKPHKKYIEALDSYTRIEAEADRGKDGYSAQINLVKESVPISVVGNNSTPYMIAKWDLDKKLVGVAGVDKYYTCVIKYKFTKKTPNCMIYPYMAGQFSMGLLDEGENISVYYPNLRYGISIDSLRLYAISASGNGGDFGSIDVDWVCLYEGKLDNPPLTFMPSKSNLRPKVQWQGTSLKVDELDPVQLKGEKGDKPTTQWQGTTLVVDGVGKNLKGEKGDTGEFSPEQLAMLEGDHASIGNLQGSVNAHNITLGQHTQQINQHSGKIDNLQGSVNAQGNTLSAHGQSISSHTTQINQHTNQIGQHGGVLSEHTQSITELTQNFGVEVPSILISNTQQYIQVLGEIEQQATMKTGRVCSTLRLTSSELPIILPCPEKFVDRQITIARLAEPLNYYALFHDCIYIHTTKSYNSVGILSGGSMPFNNFVYDSQVPAFTGCKGYRINQNVTGLNKFRALSEMDCNQSLSITFQSISYSGGYRWLLLDVSSFDARISPYEADTIWGATRQVRGQAPWTIQYNGLVVPTSKHSTNTFTITDKMNWVEFNGTGRTATMNFPTSLPEGFMCYLQNNAQNTTIAVSESNPVTSLNRIPPRSLCLCRKGSGNNMLIFQLSTI